jgi:glycosyltransferase involved in cell wall biosynthesis
MKIVFHSNAPWNVSGYGKQAALFVPRIGSLPGYEITAISAPYSFGGNLLEWQGIRVFPCARDGAGNDTILNNHEYTKADLTLTLCDVFGLMKATQGGMLQQIDIAHWFPVDCDPLGEGDLTVLREGGGIPVAMSRFGERVLRDEGTDPLFVPHGVDTQVYKPGDPEPFRSTIPQIGPDTLVIGIAAMNRDASRKGLSEQLQAFARFHRRHPDSHLALHTAQFGNPGIHLKALATRLGIASAVSYPDPYFYDMGLICEEQMATWYNGLDVLSACSYAEGFGLPLVEAQACGIPVITTDASATNELCGAGWLVSATDFWTNGHASFWRRPDIADIDVAYEAAWEAKQDGKLPKKEAEDFGKLFDADRVLEVFWKPALAAIEERIGYAGSDVSP